MRDGRAVKGRKGGIKHGQKGDVKDGMMDGMAA